MTRWTATLFLTAVLASTVVQGQPSSYTYFAFRLYDNEQIVDLDKFCNEWTIFNIAGASISPCDKESFNSYDTSSKYFYIGIGAIYPPYAFALVHKKDTMAMYFQNYEVNLICDSLTLHNGEFYFDYSCPDNEKIKLKHFSGISFCKLDNINWKLAEQKFLKYKYPKLYQYFPETKQLQMDSLQKQTASQPQTVTPQQTTSQTQDTEERRPILLYNLFHKQTRLVTITKKYYPNGKIKSKEWEYYFYKMPSDPIHARMKKMTLVYKIKKIEWDENGKREKHKERFNPPINKK